MTCAEVFERDCPYYLSIGMTYEQYWYGDVWMVRAFHKADKLRQERENTNAWLLGAYVGRAIESTIGNAFRKKGAKPAEYPKQPIELFKKEKTEEQKALEAKREREKAIAYFNKIISDCKAGSIVVPKKERI